MGTNAIVPSGGCVPDSSARLDGGVPTAAVRRTGLIAPPRAYSYHRSRRYFVAPPSAELQACNWGLSH